ncbi:eIF-2-alpha kinase GCN2-like isoform X5 [Rhodnius prolixus]|uniref:eIF-2-alpha kinase GCN2-like isoform X5 n=1 Tax=Rhodnius prolixus TaxID=13249 RepID=UPI003D1882F4
MEEDSCQDRQENEKAALMAIYGDQMKLLYDKSDMNLWKPLECILRLWPPSSQGPQKMDGPSVDLHICCPHDYPNVLPTIELEHPKKISFGDTISLRNELVQLANLLKGEVMIFELAQHVENALCSYNKPQYESFYEEMMYRNQELKESERLKRQAAEEKKLKDIKLKIRSEQQAVRKALRKKHSGAELTHLENLPAERREQAARKQYVPSKVGQGKVVTSNITEEFVPWNFPNGNLSRFKNEFEHIYWLGKGAFGDVIKVRNKLDDGFYAVKRIELNPCKIQLNKKITREVKLLSRLNHENVVRYYNSWIEMAAMEDTKSTDDSEFERNRKNRAKSPTEKLLSLQNKRDWTIDKASECTSDDSSSDTWIAFRSGSKSPMQSSMSALPKSNTNEPSVLPQTPQKTSLHMYIQMELCEKSTLRIAIDEGLFVEVERVWRLFREVVEGLCHIHQQGIIHRDLKPVNIFIDHDDHVKIGDFGLATTIIRQRHTAVGVPDNLDVTNNSGTPSSQLGKDISHTGQVGTAFYVAPELSHTNRKTQYNQKVDTYSLGIIFFEMCHPPVATSMERCKIMKDIRQVNPVFPSDFPHSPSSHQAHLIRWMLDHDVKSRPSSQEVLQCDIVPPPQLEEAEVKEMVRRTLSNPQSKDYKFLIASCFNQCPMIVSLRLIQNSHNYSGIMFQVTYDQLSKQKQVEHVLISGGRYDRLLRDLNAIILPEEVKLDQYVAGFILSIDKLVTSFNDSEKPNSADILLCSMGSIRMTPDRLHLIRDLWKSGLKTVYFNSVETMEEIQTYCQEMGILFVVILKETEPGFARVRSLAADRFSDKKIPYSELMEYIRRMKNKSNNDLGTISSMVKVRDSPLITFILTEKLNPGAKRRYENQVMNVISPALQRLSSSVKIEVLVIAIENEAFLFLSLCLDMSAGNLEINNFVKRYPRHKKYVQKIMNHFEESKKSPKPPVLILYSLQENIYKVLL